MTACRNFLDIHKLCFRNKGNILELALFQRKFVLKEHTADFRRRTITTLEETTTEIDTATTTSPTTVSFLIMVYKHSSLRYWGKLRNFGFWLLRRR
jgi:hypothetical protein